MLFAFRKILQPLFRILIRAGLQFEEFTDLARAVFVETAIRSGLDNDVPVTRARVAIQTGVARHYVDSIIDDPGNLPSSKPTLGAVLGEVLYRWHTDPSYSGPYGLPLELSLLEASGRSFKELVRTIEPTVSPSDVLAELVRIGSVSITPLETVRATSRMLLMADPMSSIQLEYFGNTLTRLASTLQYNMRAAEGHKRLERFVRADRGVPERVFPEFEAFARTKANEFLLALDDWLTPHDQITGDPDEPRINTGINVFHYVDHEINDEATLATFIK